jgi:tetratricopeptide (TPR) repeat protein
MGETRLAVEILKQALVIAIDLGEFEAESVVQGHLGAALAALGDSQGAIDCFVKQLEVARGISDRRSESSALGYLGAAHCDLADYLRAVQCFERRLTIARELGERRGEASTLADLGQTCSALNEPHMAIAFYERALPVARAIGDRRLEATVLTSQGKAYTILGEHRLAKDLYERAIDVFRGLSDRRGEGNSLLYMGEAFAKLGEPNQAIELCHRVLDIATDTGDLRLQASAFDALSVALRAHCDSKHLRRRRKGSYIRVEKELYGEWYVGMLDAIAMAERALELYEKTADDQKISSLQSRILLYSHDSSSHGFTLFLSLLSWLDPFTPFVFQLRDSVLFIPRIILSMLISLRSHRSLLLQSLTIAGRTSSAPLAAPTPILLVQWTYTGVLKGFRRLCLGARRLG